MGPGYEHEVGEGEARARRGDNEAGGGERLASQRGEWRGGNRQSGGAGRIVAGLYSAGAICGGANAVPI